MTSRGFQGKFIAAAKGTLRGTSKATWWSDAFDHQPNPMEIRRADVARQRARNRRAKASRKRNR